MIRLDIFMDTAMTATTATPTIYPAELASALGRFGAPLILDVRREAKFLESPRMVCGAVRCTPENVEAFARSHSPRTAVVYCVYGHNVSEDAVAQLAQAGWRAQRLAGGIEGGKDGTETLVEARCRPSVRDGRNAQDGEDPRGDSHWDRISAHAVHWRHLCRRSRCAPRDFFRVFSDQDPRR